MIDQVISQKGCDGPIATTRGLTGLAELLGIAWKLPGPHSPCRPPPDQASLENAEAPMPRGVQNSLERESQGGPGSPDLAFRFQTSLHLDPLLQAAAPLAAESRGRQPETQQRAGAALGLLTSCAGGGLWPGDR